MIRTGQGWASWRMKILPHEVSSVPSVCYVKKEEKEEKIKKIMIITCIP